MPNKVRGEQLLKLAEKEYRLLPTHDALARIEGRLDLGLPRLMRRFVERDLRLNDVTVVLHECSRAGGPEAPFAQLWDFALADLAAAAALAKGLVFDRFGPEELSPAKPEDGAGKAPATGG